MRFAFPLALLLLLLVPALAWMGWPSAGRGRGRAFLALGLRLAITICLALALAGAEIIRGGRSLAVVFLLDASDSMTPAVEAAGRDYIRSALERLDPQDQAAVIVFGRDALVERALSSGPDLSAPASLPVRTGTNLEAAIQLGLGMFPPGAARRMVVLSDGRFNLGHADQAVQLARASGVQILVVPLAPETGPEALVRSVDLPEKLQAGERFNLSLVIEASQATVAALRVISADQVVYQAQVALRRGSQSFQVPLQAGASGYTVYQVQIEPQLDQAYQNNRLSAFTQVEGPPRVLLVAPPVGEPLYGGEPRPDESSRLQEALGLAGYPLDLVSPAGLPSGLTGLAPYAAVILVDVPASELAQRQMEALQSYVRDLGGGLLVVGGPTSYGPGGYYRTALEETLPVEMQIQDETRRPPLALVFVIDSSGSMAETSGGVVKLQLAKEAVLRSLDLLGPGDRVGVVAFDEDARWVAPVAALADQDGVAAAVTSITAGGGTDILAGLQAVADVLPSDPAASRHVILLTDGGADPAGIPELVRRLHDEDETTLTTIGVGQDAAAYLPRLAALGGGRYHFAADPASIPSIFTAETSLAARSYLIEHDFIPQNRDPASPILAGLPGLPPLHGYVGTQARPLAETLLASDLGDPILATWQYGLGRALAFTSDASGRWGRDWIAWEGFSTFWSQAVRSVLRTGGDSNLETTVVGEGEQARISVQAVGENGSPLNGYALQAAWVDPNGHAGLTGLSQSAPGSYSGPFSPSGEGVYWITIQGDPQSPQATGPDSLRQTFGWVFGYSPEYNGQPPDPLGFCALDANPGRCLDAAAAGSFPYPPVETVRRDLPAAGQPQPAAPVLLWLAALLLPLDVAARRLALPARLAKRWLERLRARRALQRETISPVDTPSLASFRQAKNRAARLRAPTPEPGASPASRRAGEEMPAQPKPGGTQAEIYPQPSASESVNPVDESPSTTAALLAAQRRRRQKRDQD